MAYVGNIATGAITEVSTLRQSVAATIPVSLGYAVLDAKLSPDGTRLYVVTASGLSIVDTASGAVVATIQSTVQARCGLGDCSAGAVDISPDGALLYVATVTPYPDLGYFALTVIDTTSHQVAAAIPLNAQPKAVAIASDGQAYVTTLDAPYGVMVIDTATRTMTGTIPLDLPAEAVAISPDGQLIYAATWDNQNSYVEIADTRTRRVTASISVPRVATGLAVTPDGRTVFVSTYGAVVAIDAATRRVVTTIPARRPVRVAISRDGLFAYVTDYDAGALLVIDTSTNTLVETIAVGPIPLTVVAAPDHGQVYVLPPWGPSAIWVADLTTRRVTSITPGYAALGGVAFSPDGRRAYVLNTAYTDELLIVDTAARHLLTRIPLAPPGASVRASPGRVAVSPDGATLYTPTNPVAVIDTAEARVSATIALPTSEPPVAIALSPDGTRAYALGTAVVDSQQGVSRFEKAIFVIETGTRTVAATTVLTPTGIPSDIAITPDGRFAYVALVQPPPPDHGEPLPGHIVIVDTATQQVAASFVDAPQEIAIAPKGDVAYVATDRDTITVIDAVHQVVAGSLNVGGQQQHIAVTPDGAFVYATSYGPALFIIDAARNAIAGTVYVGGSAGAIAIGSDSVPVCPGDCDGSGWVSVSNIVKGVNILLGYLDIGACASLDRNGDARVSIDDLIAAVNAALDGC